MKKAITTILLMTFIFSTPVFANNSAAIVSDTPQTQNDKIETNIQVIEEKDEILNKYNKKFRKYAAGKFESFNKEEINSKLKGYENYFYPQIDNLDKNDSKILKFELQDGDYAILNTNISGCDKYKYAVEYHKDGSLFGIVQIRTIRKTKKTITIQFNEYRVYEDLQVYVPTHTMFVDIEKTKDKLNIAQFVYKNVLKNNFDINKLVCAQINNDLYLNETSKNLIIEMKKFDVPHTYTKAAENRAENAGTLVGSILLAPIAIPMFVIAVPITIVFLIEMHRWID